MQEVCLFANGTALSLGMFRPRCARKSQTLASSRSLKTNICGLRAASPPLCIPLPKTPRYVHMDENGNADILGQHRRLTYCLTFATISPPRLCCFVQLSKGGSRLSPIPLIRSHIADLNPSSTSVPHTRPLWLPRYNVPVSSHHLPMLPILRLVWQDLSMPMMSRFAGGYVGAKRGMWPESAPMRYDTLCENHST